MITKLQTEDLPQMLHLQLLIQLGSCQTLRKLYMGTQNVQEEVYRSVELEETI